MVPERRGRLSRREWKPVSEIARRRRGIYLTRRPRRPTAMPSRPPRSTTRGRAGREVYSSDSAYHAAPTRRTFCRLKVVQSAEHVVVPTRRKGEALEFGLDDSACAVRPEEPVREQKLSAATLRGTHLSPSGPTAQLVVTQAFENTDARVHRRVRRATRPTTVPAAIRHLLIQQMLGNCLEPLVVASEVGDERQCHPRDAGLAPLSSEIDAAVGTEAFIEQELTRSARRVRRHAAR